MPFYNPRPQYKKTGFTLFEVLAVCVIMGLAIALLSSPLKGMMIQWKHRNAVSQVKKQLLTAKSRALSNPSLHCGVFFQSGKNPQTFMFQDSYGQSDYQFDLGKDSIYQEIQPLPNGTLLNLPTGFPPEVIFRGDGSAYLSGKVVLTTGHREDTVDVLASTGRIRILRKP
jgi:type II secretory pathway pseudopilin PulG